VAEPDKAAAVAEAQRLMREAGLSANKAAERVGAGLAVTGRTVKLWAQKAGTPLGALSQEQGKTRGARDALRGYTVERRLALCDRLLGAVEGHVDGADAAGMQKLAMSFAILSDKREHLEGVAACLAAYGDPAYWAWVRAQQDDIAVATGGAPFRLLVPGLGPERFHQTAPALEVAGRRLEEERAARYADDDEDEEDDEDEDGAEDAPEEEAAGGLPELLRAQVARRLTDDELLAELRQRRPEPPPPPRAATTNGAAPAPVRGAPTIRWTEREEDDL
jgi:hypothetical protein